MFLFWWIHNKWSSQYKTKRYFYRSMILTSFKQRSCIRIWSGRFPVFIISPILEMRRWENSPLQSSWLPAWHTSQWWCDSTMGGGGGGGGCRSCGWSGRWMAGSGRHHPPAVRRDPTSGSVSPRNLKHREPSHTHTQTHHCGPRSPSGPPNEEKHSSTVREV